MLFGNADVKGTIREPFGKDIDPGTRRHGGRNRGDLVIGFGKSGQRFAVDLGVGRCIGCGLGLFAGDNVELGDTMILVGGIFGRAIALALLGHDMNQDRAIDIRIAHVFQHWQKMIQIMPINRPDIEETHFFKQGPAGHHAAGIFLDLAGGFFDLARQMFGQALGRIAQALIALARNQARQITRHGAHRRGNRHVVIIQDHNHALIGGGGIVHRLVGHAGTHGAIADHGNDVFAFIIGKLIGDRHAKPGRDRGRAVPGTERVIFRLGSFGKARKPAALTKGADTITPPRQDFMRIALMPDIPDQPVVGRIKQVMDRHGQLDHAKPRPQMPAGDRHGINHLGTQFICDLLHLCRLQAAQISRGVNRVQKRGLGGRAHTDLDLQFCVAFFYIAFKPTG